MFVCCVLTACVHVEVLNAPYNGTAIFFVVAARPVGVVHERHAEGRSDVGHGLGWACLPLRARHQLHVRAVSGFAQSVTCSYSACDVKRLVT